MISKEDRKIVFNKYNGHCAYCGEVLKFERMQVDHIIPQYLFVTHIKNKFRIPEFLTHLKEEDVDHIDNLMPTCASCNNWKRTFNIELFRSEIQEQVNRLNKTSANYRLAKRYGLVKEIKNPVTFYFELSTIN